MYLNTVSRLSAHHRRTDKPHILACRLRVSYILCSLMFSTCHAHAACCLSAVLARHDWRNIVVIISQTVCGKLRRRPGTRRTPPSLATGSQKRPATCSAGCWTWTRADA